MSVKLKNPHTGESLTFMPESGGTITSLVLGKEPVEILRNDSLDELELNPLYRGRFLFPFNDRIPEGRYSFNGRSFKLPVNCFDDGSAIHGFLYKERVDVVEKTGSRGVFTWRTDNTTLPGYPFVLSLRTEIYLYGGGVFMEFLIRNEGNNPAPFAIGWHSYFKTDSSSMLHAGYPCFFDVDSSFLPVGNCIPTIGTDFDFSTEPAAVSGKELDHTFKTPNDGVSILYNKNYTVKIAQKNFAYTQLFVPPQGDSIAIEPISSKPNSFNTQDVLVLPPGRKYLASIDVGVAQ